LKEVITIAEQYDKFSVRRILSTPVKLFGFPKNKDKIEALVWLKENADFNDLQYVFPLVFNKNRDLALVAAQITAGVMGTLNGREWNRIYEQVRYIDMEENHLAALLNFPDEVSVHLLGIASLNSSCYIREKALRLMGGQGHCNAIPYILLRLNDWVHAVSQIASHVLPSMLREDCLNILLDHSYLIEKMHNAMRVDLQKTRQDIIGFLSNPLMVDKLKGYLKHPQIKIRLFAFMLLENQMAVDTEIIDMALKDKSPEVKRWLIASIQLLNLSQQRYVIAKLLSDKSGRIKNIILQRFEVIICADFREQLEELIFDNSVSAREAARFILKRHLCIEDFAEVYRKELCSPSPRPGAIVGLGETGNLDDYVLVSQFTEHEDNHIRVAALCAMWYLSKEVAVNHVLHCFNDDVIKIRKTARCFLKKSKLPIVLAEMKKFLDSGSYEAKLAALDIIYNYGGWDVLESVLFVLAHEEDELATKAQILLERWLIRASTIYSNPGLDFQNKMRDYLQQISVKKVLPELTLKQIHFLLDTRVR
jgi:hypothetical protein